MPSCRFPLPLLLVALSCVGCDSRLAPPEAPCVCTEPRPDAAADAEVDASTSTTDTGSDARVLDARVTDDSGARDGGSDASDAEDAAADVVIEPWDPNAIRIGWGTVDMTPPLDPPVRMRFNSAANSNLATGVMDPITATAMAVASPLHPEGTVVLISADLLFIPDGSRDSRDLISAVRERVVARLGDELDPQQIIIMATHTHVAPTIVAEVIPFYAGRMADAAVEAWETRQPAGVSYGLGHAVAGHNRIVTHVDGTSRMTGSEQGGSTSNSNFSHMESFEDHSVHLLYTFDSSRSLTGVVVNITCPSQVQRGLELSADFWHEVREELNARVGRQVPILVQVSAAGEVATTVMVEEAGEARMARLRYPDLEDRAPRRAQIAHRIVETILEVLPVVEATMEQTPLLAHVVSEVDLPSHPKYRTGEPRGPCPEPDGTTFYAVELHSVRIADIAMITNPFELYLDYGTRIKGRSPAIQTFVVELAGGGSYLPTRRAVAAGGYGSRTSECRVGPAGGDVLVDVSLSLLNELWSVPEP